jgi:hypothetical protein
MTEKPTYKELERKTKQLESEVLEYLRKEKEFNKERKLVEYGHMKRTISLMKINAELNREIKDLKRADKEELGVLQAIVDFIPPAIQYPEITCARIMFDGYEFTTKNFKDTQWKLSQEIKVNNERIGALEVCYLEKKPELEEGQFLKEAKNLITAIAESIAQIVERDWAEIEIRKCRNKIEEFIKPN